VKGILGTKVGMTQVWRGDKLVPVTVVLAGPCPVVQRKTPERDGYAAVQLGWVEKSDKAAIRPEVGHAKKAGVKPHRHLVELRDYAPEGDAVTVDIFAAGEKVDVTGTSKGRGTAGVIKRWGFAGMPATHGVKKKHRPRARSGSASSPAASTRASAWRATTAPSASPRSASRSSRSGPTTASSSSRVRCPVRTAASSSCATRRGR
jgi:large subunit ribosomal protein L3